MKNFLYRATVVFILIFSFIFVTQPAIASTNWEAFSTNIEHSLKSGNLGVQKSAMMHIIKYSDRLKVNNALDDIIELYKTADDETTREIALLAVFSLDSKTAVELLNERVQEDFDGLMKEKLNKYLSKF